MDSNNKGMTDKTKKKLTKAIKDWAKTESKKPLPYWCLTPEEMAERDKGLAQPQNIKR